MIVTMQKALITGVKRIEPEGKKPFQVLSFMEVSNGGEKSELDVSAPADQDFGNIPLLLPCSVTLTIKPVRAGYRQMLILEGISIKKGGE